MNVLSTLVSIKIELFDSDAVDTSYFSKSIGGFAFWFSRLLVLSAKLFLVLRCYTKIYNNT